MYVLIILNGDPVTIDHEFCIHHCNSHLLESSVPTLNTTGYKHCSSRNSLQKLMCIKYVKINLTLQLCNLLWQPRNHIAVDDTNSKGNGTTGNENAGNVLIDNGNGP
jgi:hypothetical protein